MNQISGVGIAEWTKKHWLARPDPRTNWTLSVAGIGFRGAHADMQCIPKPIFHSRRFMHTDSLVEQEYFYTIHTCRRWCMYALTFEFLIIGPLGVTEGTCETNCAHTQWQHMCRYGWCRRLTEYGRYIVSYVCIRLWSHFHGGGNMNIYLTIAGVSVCGFTYASYHP